ncbi:MAG TPA: tetratricopeptide repeat protein [Chthoniobacterales bacterium]
MTLQGKWISARRRTFANGIWTASLFAVCLAGDVAAANEQLYTEAIQAINEGIPQVGIQKLREYLAGTPPEKGRTAATLRLAEALLAAGSYSEAGEILQSAPDTPERQFLVVQIHLAAGEWAEALNSLGSLVSTDSPFKTRALFAKAEALRGLGRTKEAADVYAPLVNDHKLGTAAALRQADIALDAGDLAQAANLLKELRPKTTSDQQLGRYLHARLALAQKNFSEARDRFEQLRENPAFLSAEILAGVHVGLARALQGQDQRDAAEDVLESFIADQPHNPRLDTAFAELDHVYQADDNPSATQLRRWRDMPPENRQALALLYLAYFDRRERGNDQALKDLRSWVQKFPSHPLLPKVHFETGRILIAENNGAEAIGEFDKGLAAQPGPDVVAQLQAAAGAAYFTLQDFPAAADRFNKAAIASPSQAEPLLFNSALAILQTGDFKKFVEAYQEFSKRFPQSNLRSDLLLEEGLLQARTGDRKTARETFNLFIRDFPERSRIPAAHLALGEMSFTADPPDLIATSAELKQTSQSIPSADVAERAAYLALFLHDTQGKTSDADLLAEAVGFIEKYPASPLVADVRMKMGEIYFRQKDFPNAQTQFELVAKDFNDSPLLEKARFLAARSAIRTMNPDAVDGAIDTLDKVVRMKGPLSLWARYEQAIVKRDTGKLDDAIVLFDDLLSQNPEPDLAAAALARKGETFYLEGATDTKAYERAVSVFDTLATTPSIALYWRNLALYKKAKSLEKLGRTDEALVAYYDVINPKGDSTEPEYLWFYRAGFDAAQILESGEKWEAAVAIYRKLADSSGPRAKEAADRMKQLQLEHFIWN